MVNVNNLRRRKGPTATTKGQHPEAPEETIAEKVLRITKEFLDKRSRFWPAKDVRDELIYSFQRDKEAGIETTGPLKLSLCDPISGVRIRIPVRSINCSHFQCFNLATFLESSLQDETNANAWLCPKCECSAKLGELFIDGYFKEILEKVGPEPLEVALLADGNWQEVEQMDEKMVPFGDSDEITLIVPRKKARVEDHGNSSGGNSQQQKQQPTSSSSLIEQQLFHELEVDSVAAAIEEIQKLKQRAASIGVEVNANSAESFSNQGEACQLQKTPPTAAIVSGIEPSDDEEMAEVVAMEVEERGGEKEVPGEGETSDHHPLQHVLPSPPPNQNDVVHPPAPPFNDEGSDDGIGGEDDDDKMEEFVVAPDIGALHAIIRNRFVSVSTVEHQEEQGEIKNDGHHETPPAASALGGVEDEKEDGEDSVIDATTNNFLSNTPQSTSEEEVSPLLVFHSNPHQQQQNDDVPEGASLESSTTADNVIVLEYSENKEQEKAGEDGEHNEDEWEEADNTSNNRRPPILGSLKQNYNNEEEIVILKVANGDKKVAIEKTEDGPTLDAPREKNQRKNELSNCCSSTEDEVDDDDFSSRLRQHSCTRSVSSRRSSSSSAAVYRRNRAAKDDSDGHLICTRGNLIKERYEIFETLVKGKFAKVLQVKDRERRKRVDFALKIFKNASECREAARRESEVLNLLEKKDPRGKYPIAQLFDSFDFQGHKCLVFELFGPSVFDFMRQNNFERFPMRQIRAISRQLIQAVKFMHANGLTHADLKPENILFVSGACEEKTPVKVIRDPSIRLIGLDSAIFDNDDYRPKISSTSAYHAPELALELDWAQPCDVWSIGCIMFELYMGRTLFPARTRGELLAMMECVIGEKIPHRMAIKTKIPEIRDGQFDWNKTSASGEFVLKSCFSLERYKKSDGVEDRDLFALVGEMLDYDEYLRITLREAMEHRFFRSKSEGVSASGHQLQKKKKTEATGKEGKKGKQKDPSKPSKKRQSEEISNKKLTASRRNDRAEVLRIITRCPEFQPLCQLIRRDPAELSGFLRHTAQCNPEVYELIRENRQQFFDLINDDDDSVAAAAEGRSKLIQTEIIYIK